MNAPVREKSGRDRTAKAAPFDKGAFFRLSRMLHAYLSAFAFLTLIFFSATGVLLNHPEWFEAYQPAEHQVAFALTSSELAAANSSKDRGRALAAAAAKHAPLPGAYLSADIDGRQALVRMEGPKGSADLTVDLVTGKAEGRVTKPNLTAVIQDLHRGKNSGGAWRWVIDLSAWLVLGLSLIGYVLFFSLRFRLKTSLILTAVSLAVLVGVAWAFVP
ncbi:MAG: PepSY-associated TM helix domain-containing protein [Caulobacteraceae bacterium]